MFEDSCETDRPPKKNYTFFGRQSHFFDSFKPPMIRAEIEDGGGPGRDAEGSINLAQSESGHQNTSHHGSKATPFFWISTHSSV